MNAQERAAIASLAQHEAAAAVSALAAAERAVAAGHLNAAKVLRAAAHSARVRALTLERLAGEGSDTLADVRFHAESTRFARVALEALGAGVQQLLDAVQSSQRLLDETLRGLEQGRDVRESEIAQFVWGCGECGLLIEADRPEICPACGSIGGDFEMFAPFFSATSEHLGRRRPAEIIEMLNGDAAALGALLSDVPEEVLVRQSAEGEWCMKEVAGHMIDIAELFGRRARATLDPGAPAVAERTPLPWKLIEGQNYPEMAVPTIVSRFGVAVAEALAIVSSVESKDWRRRGELSVGRISLIDMASWLVNHNLAHAKQIARLREAATKPT